VNHSVVFPFFRELKNATLRRWSIVSVSAMWSAVLLMHIMGLPIYFALGDKTASNITNNFPHGPLMSAVRVSLAIAVLISTIYLQRAGRTYLHSLVMPILRRRSLVEDEQRMSMSEVFFFTSLQFVVTLYLGIATEDLGLPMALTGVFAQSLAAFIIPPLLLFTMMRHDPASKISRLSRCYFTVVLVFGIASCTLGVNRTIADFSRRASATAHSSSDAAFVPYASRSTRSLKPRSRTGVGVRVDTARSSVAVMPLATAAVLSFTAGMAVGVKPKVAKGPHCARRAQVQLRE